MGTLEKIQVSDSSLIAPSPPRAGKSQTHQEILGCITLPGGGGGSKKHTAGCVPKLWQQSENLGDPGNIWIWETWWERWWAATGCDPDRLWTCQRVGLCGKQGVGSEQQQHPKRLYSKGELRCTMKGRTSSIQQPGQQIGKSMGAICSHSVQLTD